MPTANLLGTLRLWGEGGTAIGGSLAARAPCKLPVVLPTPTVTGKTGWALTVSQGLGQVTCSSRAHSALLCHDHRPAPYG